MFAWVLTVGIQLGQPAETQELGRETEPTGDGVPQADGAAEPDAEGPPNNGSGSASVPSAEVEGTSPVEGPEAGAASGTRVNPASPPSPTIPPPPTEDPAGDTDPDTAPEPSAALEPSPVSEPAPQQESAAEPRAALNPEPAPGLQPDAAAERKPASKDQADPSSDLTAFTPRKSMAHCQRSVELCSVSPDGWIRVGEGQASPTARRILGNPVHGNGSWFSRGLDTRYQATFLDGARLPGPYRGQRTAPLDLIPPGMVGAVHVQETGTPDRPGDFTGAALRYDIAAAPETFAFDLRVRSGLDTASVGSVRAADRFGADSFAFGNLSRALDDTYDTAGPIQRGLLDDDLMRVYSDAEIESFGEGFASTKTAVDSRAALPNLGLGGTVGGTVPAGAGKLGLQAGLVYDSLSLGRKTETTPHAYDAGDGRAIQLGDTRGDSNRRDTQWSAMGGLRWEADTRHRIDASVLYARSASSVASFEEGTENTMLGDTLVTTQRLGYGTNALAFGRLGGSHRMGERRLLLEWFGSVAHTLADDPLSRETRHVSGDGSTWFLENAGAIFSFRRDNELTGSGGLDFSVPFRQWGGLDSRVKMGAWLEATAYEVSGRSFTFSNVAGVPTPEGRGNILNPDTIGGGDPSSEEPFFVNEITGALASAEGTRAVYAGYALLDLPLARWVRLDGGARVEVTRMQAVHVDPYDRLDSDGNRADGVDILPMAGLLFAVSPQMNVRASGNRTLRRPTFDMLAPIGQPIVDDDLEISGVWNADLRWEWFSSDTELVAVGAFYKNMQDPLTVRFDPAGAFQSTDNGDVAHVAGGQLDLRKNFGFAGDRLRGLWLGGQLTYSHARSDPGDGMGTRSFLIGHVPWVAGASIGYDESALGLRSRLSYALTGGRVVVPGSGGVPDTIAEPIHMLNVSLAQRVYQGLFVTVDALNLLGSRVVTRWEDPDAQLQSIRQGRVFLFGLGFRAPT